MVLGKDAGLITNEMRHIKKTTTQNHINNSQISLEVSDPVFVVIGWKKKLVNLIPWSDSLRNIKVKPEETKTNFI